AVVLEDDVEIGAGTAIDRATIGLTRIGARTKIDNLCHIAHNCVLGTDCALAAGVMIAGSTSIGDRCVLGGAVGIGGHLKLVADVRVGGASVVLKDLLQAGEYMGHPVMEKLAWLRTMHGLHDFLAMREQFVEQRRADRKSDG
ncbi:MAG: UDP-3-O-(3-hydroxymyristoyl)glucosamine N-acyltransferase, partial [Planctomycetes bacterium]|nr:UDP-3-O-(3-hydroxymyristoyl)glucosamine N-acyltransferase [Planctomycetota bacterium]